MGRESYFHKGCQEYSVLGFQFIYTEPLCLLIKEKIIVVKAQHHCNVENKMCHINCCKLLLINDADIKVKTSSMKVSYKSLD